MSRTTDLSHREIQNNSVLRMFGVAITRRALLASALRLIWTALSEFFVPQYYARYRFTKRPVVSVDHPLDNSIPFKPEYIDTYLHFIPVWIKSLYFIYREFGEQTLPAIRDFVREIDRLYREAGIVYRRCQSTTDRPRFLDTLRFKVIHAIDPHLHCVPSLHVLIVMHNALRIPQLIDRFRSPLQAYTEQKEYVYDQAVRIVESILFVKQHSVNCIPAALFAMTNLHPDFDRASARRLIEDLFTRLEQGLETERDIKEFLDAQYDRFFVDQGTRGSDYKDVLTEYLLSFPRR